VSASPAATAPIVSFDRILMAVILRFQRPLVGRTEQAQPSLVAIQLPSDCGLAQPSRPASAMGAPHGWLLMKERPADRSGPDQEFRQNASTSSVRRIGRFCCGADGRADSQLTMQNGGYARGSRSQRIVTERVSRSAA
jgi:hypothetical protein